MATAKWIAMAAVSLAASAQAGEEGDLSTRSRSLAKSIEATATAPAPFVARAESAATMAMPGPAALERSVPCADGMRALCYDSRDRGVVYRGAREYMPHVQGLTPEGVALRHDRLILRYSFR